MARLERYSELNNIPSRGKMIEELNLFCMAQPLERPRLGKGGTFYTPRDNQLRIYKEINYYAKLRKKAIDVPIIVDCFFYFEMNTNDKYPVAAKYGDIDNLTKSIYDGMNASTSLIRKELVCKKIISDDRYIIGGESFKLYDKEDDEGNTDNYIVVRIYKAL